MAIPLRTAIPLLIVAGTMVSCSSTPQTASAPQSPQTPHPVAQCDLNTPNVQAAPPSPHVLDNVHRIGSKMISGAVPENDAAFDELRSMGVKTIISVDGAVPEVDKASARGMRYVHIPITYAEATREQQLELARAVRDLPGPIYIHCHHGKHRSPAAAAAVAVTLGEVSPDDGVAFMKTAGTAPNYTGLYACVANAVVASVAALDAAPSTFPSVQTPRGITGEMVEIDGVCDRLGLIRAAGWTTPVDHPDLVPASEAGQLADHFRFGGQDPHAKSLGDDFQARLSKAVADATALEEAIVAKSPREVLETKWKPVVASCKDCHAKYRDVKP